MTALKTVRVPPEMSTVFQAAEEVVSRYFAERRDIPEHGAIEVHGERYVLVRAAALSVEFFTLVRGLYGEERADEADEFARNILFDLAHAIGKSDARSFHAKMGLSDPIARLSAGPVHFAHTGWASVDISAESQPSPDEDFHLVYEHPYSFEASAWLDAAKRASFPVCVMNAGYSSGWCDESFGVTLVATEVLCRARGDDVCRFVMAHPHRIEARVSRYLEARPDRPAPNYQIPDFFIRKRMEEELRKSRDELEVRVRNRTAELEEANRRLLQAQKLEAVGQLAGGIAHDFNNLLSVILMRATLLQARVARDDPVWKELEEIRSVCQRGGSLGRQLLAFSRNQPTERRLLELGQLVREMQRGLLPLLGEDIEVIFEMGHEAHLEGDPSQLEQVIMNLLLNARDAMPNGGTLRIRVDTAQLNKTSVTTGTLPEGRYATLAIEDTGEGMDAETLARVFDPFFTTKPQGKGTGLGLSTVYGIVTQAGGGIAVESIPGKGTSFILFFPGVGAPGAPAESASEPTEPRCRGGRIMIVEDQADLRESLCELLKLAGYELIGVDGGIAALQVLEQETAPVDLIITDLVMPGMGGRELVDRVRRRWPRMRVIFMSGYDRDQIAEGKQLDEAGPILRKPFQIDELTRRIEDAFHSKDRVA